MSRGEKWANAILRAGGLLAVGALCYVVYAYDLAGKRQFTGATGAILYHGLPALAAAALFAALRLPVIHRINLALALASTVLSLYAVELLLADDPAFLRPAVPDFVRASGAAYDGRSKLEVIEDMRREGINALPTVTPKILLTQQADRRLRSAISSAETEILPLGWVSNSVAVFCNENGYWVSFRSDEHGFLNPPGTWSGKRITLAAVGDSFTQGYCVAPEQNFISLARTWNPGMLNLAVSGNGPLIELAGVAEYLRHVRPAKVLWFFAEVNDLCDLQVERNSPLLMRYLETQHDQNLLGTQGTIDRSLLDYIERARRDLRIGRLLNVARLATLRERLGLLYARSEERRHFEQYGCREVDGALYPTAFGPDAAALLRAILQQARQAVQGWGGELIFVYLPEWQRYHDPQRANPHRNEVLAIVESLDLDLLDLHPVFAGHPDPLALFPFRRQGHYNEAGHRVVAEALQRKLASVRTPSPPRTVLRSLP